MTVFVLNLTAFVLHMNELFLIGNGYALKMTRFVLDVTWYVLNMTIRVLNRTGFVQNKTKFVNNMSVFVFNMKKYVLNMKPILTSFEIGCTGLITQENKLRLKHIHKFWKKDIKLKTFVKNCYETMGIQEYQVVQGEHKTHSNGLLFSNHDISVQNKSWNPLLPSHA